MDRQTFKSFIFWFSVIIVLFVISNVYHSFVLNRIPLIIVLIPAILLVVYRFYKAKQIGKLDWRRKVYKQFEVKHIIGISMFLIIVAFSWLFFILHYVRNNQIELIFVAIVPTVILTLLSSILLSVGLYYARGE